jgi:signal peptidase I
VIAGALLSVVMLWEPRQIEPEAEPELPYEPPPKLEEEVAARGSRWAVALPSFILGFAALAVGALATIAIHGPGWTYLVFVGPMALGTISILLGVLQLNIFPRTIERRYLTVYREVVETLLLALLIFLAVSETVQNFKVEGNSMLPSLETDQYIIVNRLAYAQFDLGIFDFLPFFDAGDDSTHHLFGGPDRGDVVVFESLSRSDRDFIKRIIGLPGDEVEIHDGLVYINDEPLDEPYIRGTTTCSGKCSWVVPEDHYFVLGDNRNNSSDSRTIGPIPEKNIIGKTWFSYWPISDIGLAPNHSVSFANEDSED